MENKKIGPKESNEYRELNQVRCKLENTTWVSMPGDDRRSASRRNRRDCLSPESRETPTLRRSKREREPSRRRWEITPRECRDNACDEDARCWSNEEEVGGRQTEGETATVAARCRWERDTAMVLVMRRLSSRVLATAGGFRG